MREVIVRNSIRCRRCGQEIESHDRHDFRWCKCRAVAVDGGHSYLKRVGEMDDWIETSIVRTEPDE